MRFLVLLLCAALVGCGPEAVSRKTEVLVLGDSVMAWNGLTGAAVADAIGAGLGRRVADRSRSGATLLADRADPISTQFRTGAWDWLVFDGGANDLASLCGCSACDDVTDRLISPDGRAGAIPSLVVRARETGARVIFMGAYRAAPDRRTFLGCEDDLDEVDRRALRMAARDPGVIFVSGKSVIDPNNPAHFFIDGVHPSREGSARLGAMIAAAIRGAETR